MSGELERQQGEEEEVASSGAALNMLDKALLGGVILDVLVFYVWMFGVFFYQK